MKVVLNMKEFQLLELLEALGAGTARVKDIVINTKEEEFKKEHRDLTTEDLQRIQEVMKQDGNGQNGNGKDVII